MSVVPQVQPAQRSHQEWAAAAERADLETIAGEMTVDPDSGFTAMMVTLGPKFCVRRFSERFARQLGFIVTSVRRDGTLVNPLTAEVNKVYAIRLERRQ